MDPDFWLALVSTSAQLVKAKGIFSITTHRASYVGDIGSRIVDRVTTSDHVHKGHPYTTFWADESLVRPFHHVVLSKPTGHGSSSFRTFFHVVGVLCPFPTCLLPVCATPRDVTF